MKHKLTNKPILGHLARCLAIVATLIAILITGVVVRESQAATSIRNIVLVHGAWADGSGWNDVIKKLQSEGYHVTAVQLPLTSLADDVARTRAVLAAQDGPTLLVAHSYGGSVITQLGTDTPNVVGLVYIAAFAPAEGETGLDLLSHATPTPALAAIYPDATGYLWLNRDGFVQHFASGVNHVQASVLAAGQKPINSAVFAETFGPPAWQSLPSWYLIAENDQVIHPNDQHFFATRMGATTSTIASGHLPMISKPNRVAEFLMNVTGQLGS